MTKLKENIIYILKKYNLFINEYAINNILLHLMITIDRIKKNSNITALTLEKLCLILDCQPNDVITFVQK